MAARPVADFESVGFSAPRGVLATLLRPRLWHRVWQRPLGIRILPPANPQAPGHHLITLWTYDPLRHGKRICVEFRSLEAYRREHDRWRVIADTLWRLIDKHPRITFRDIAIDLGDGEADGMPSDVFRFARRPGQPHELLPNPYLLRPRKRLATPIPWERKTDVLYFRGAATGSRNYSTNIRVAACRLTRNIPDSDCRLTSFPEVLPDFVAAARHDGITGAPAPLVSMSRHRFLLDIDGNTSSWDRFLVIGTFGCVPIRFETMWEECWHPLLHEDEHYVSAATHTLADVVGRLRSQPRRAKRIAAGAAVAVRDALSPEGVDGLFERTWLRRIRRGG